MTGPVPLPRQYPAHLQLCYRGVKYRPAALQLFVARGGWGDAFTPKRRVLSGSDCLRESECDGSTRTPHRIY